MKNKEKELEKLLNQHDEGLILLRKGKDVTCMGTEPTRLGFLISQVMEENDEFANAFSAAVQTRLILDKEFAKKMQTIGAHIRDILDKEGKL